jgi:hypothetical protein
MQVPLERVLQDRADHLVRIDVDEYPGCVRVYPQRTVAVVSSSDMRLRGQARPRRERDITDLSISTRSGMVRDIPAAPQHGKV